MRPTPHHRLTKQPGTAACICGGSGLLLYLFTLQLSTCRYGFLECLMPFCCNRVRRKWRCRCAQWWHPRGWHRGNPRSCPWKGYSFWRSHNGGQQLLPAVPAFGQRTRGSHPGLQLPAGWPSGRAGGYAAVRLPYPAGATGFRQKHLTCSLPRRC